MPKLCPAQPGSPQACLATVPCCARSRLQPIQARAHGAVRTAQLQGACTWSQAAATERRHAHTGEGIGEHVLPRGTLLNFDSIPWSLGRGELSFKLTDLFPGSMWACVGSSPYPVSFLACPGFLALIQSDPSQGRSCSSVATILAPPVHAPGEDFPLCWFFLSGSLWGTDRWFQ